MLLYRYSSVSVLFRGKCDIINRLSESLLLRASLALSNARSQAVVGKLMKSVNFVNPWSVNEFVNFVKS